MRDVCLFRGIVLCVLFGCAGTYGDEFRSKIPVYCKTSDACASLLEEARERVRACEKAEGQPRCREERLDEARIRSLQSEALALELRAQQVADRTQQEIDNEDARRRLLDDLEYNKMALEAAAKPRNEFERAAECEATRKIRCEATRTLNERRHWVWRHCKGGNSVALNNRSRGLHLVVHEDWTCPPGTAKEYLETIPVMDISTAIERETFRCSAYVRRSFENPCEAGNDHPLGLSD